MYSIIDIETTGGNAYTSKVIEISVFVHDGKKIIRTFNSLINPERTIPPFITNLTGITNEMVEDAPRFYEIAKELIEVTEGNVFVAHNVNFDYSFIREEYKTLGYNFERDRLCTCRLSRKLIPGKQSYSLGRLCQSVGIPMKDRHRASGDAEATSRLFELLLNLDTNNFITKSKNIYDGFSYLNVY